MPYDTESRDWDGFPPMNNEQKLDLLALLMDKLALILQMKGAGINVESAESGVRRQISDTLTKGEIHKI